MLNDDPRELPGFRKKSFALPYHNGLIWFEHLDGLFDNATLALEKLNMDRPVFCRPSMPAIIGFVVDETEMTHELISAIADSLRCTDKLFQRVCFIGADRRTQRALSKVLADRRFSLAFINDFEQAKDWLIPG